MRAQTVVREALRPNLRSRNKMHALRLSSLQPKTCDSRCSQTLDFAIEEGAGSD